MMVKRVSWLLWWIIVPFCQVIAAFRQDNTPVCNLAGPGPVRRVEDLEESSYGRPGLSHITVAGATRNGLQEVEVWMQMFAPGSGTPIHRHDCEEVFLVLRGKGSFFVAAATEGSSYGGTGSGGSEEAGAAPWPPQEHPVGANSTFVVPPNQVHKVLNSAASGDLQLLVVISKPPIRVYTYQDWSLPHANATLQFPYPWDAVCSSSTRLN